MNEEPIVKITHLHHFFGQGALRKQILFDVHLEIYPGEIVLMTGPSGSGKTTLLTLIGGLRSVQEGSLQVMGQELFGASTFEMVQVRRQMGYIFQAHNLLRSLTVRQNVQMMMELHDEIPPEKDITQTETILKTVGLGERLDYYPQGLSGGQKQRVAIARALVTRPSLVLADEPTAALDSKSGRDVVELMQQLAKDQACTILIPHSAL
jgi:putative ABC transport system ATP-binding protein